MSSGTCHCGALTIQVPRAPATLTCCNCSMCRRLGTLWGYYAVDEVKVHGHPAHTEGYVQGDRMLRTLRCKTCGCVSHWEPIAPEAGGRCGVNMRNFEPALLQRARLELLDGANTWTAVFADDVIGTPRRPNRGWHEAHRMPPKATTAQRVEWHKAHALACGCRPVPPAVRRLIEEGQGA